MQSSGLAQSETSKSTPIRYENVLKCPECPPEEGYEIIETNSDWVCSGCGIVMENVIDEGAEWRNFQDDGSGSNVDGSRVGGGLSGDGSFEPFATMISENNKSRALARAERRGKDADKRLSAQRYYSRIDEFCDACNLSQAVKDQAFKFYKITQGKKVFSNKPKQNALLGSLVFLACRQINQERSFREVHAWTGESKKNFISTFKELEKFLRKMVEAQTAKYPAKKREVKEGEVKEGEVKEGEVKEGDEKSGEEDGARAATKVERVQGPVARFVSTMGFRDSFLVEKTAIELAKKAEHFNTPFDGRAPSTLAAAYLCMASHLVGEPRKFREVAKGCGIGPVTVKATLGSMMEVKDRLVDKQWRGVDMSRLESILKN
ncbi:putative transcription initiation factor IIB [Apiospora kogelbergensis]|uniref:putative transcription initiation factor IIB n=1 Tax=Apiospora kogelbergensis TaxID=1337665 RepID=UPI00312DC4DD